MLNNLLGQLNVNLDSSNLRGFVKTLPTESDPPSGDYGVYALFCDMCDTTGGFELTRVPVIDRELDTVYESLVKPNNSIIDYNTRFRGITEDVCKHVVTTVLDEQAALLALFNEKTILIGHSLESDLIHSAVVDTGVVFPHKMGPPKKRALKTLCWEHLNKIIPESESGHDSAEDATACMELMKWNVGHCDSR
ncbi:putative exonuclease GOR [Blattella germanica]|nr:putative exonuclease GOR [Blattella germanica]